MIALRKTLDKLGKDLYYLRMTTTSSESTSIAGFPATICRPADRRPGTAPVLLLHGAFADHRCFDGWVARLGAGGRLAVAPSRRGRHGVGPERAAGVSFDDYVADTLAVVDALGEDPVLVGHSLGGLVAQKVAEQGRARAVVLLASAPPGMLTAQAVALPHFGPLLPRIMAGKAVIVPDGACSALALNHVPEEQRPAIHAGLVHESGRVYRSLMIGTVRVDAAKVTVPVFVAGAADDRLVSSRLVRRTAKHYGVEPHLLDGHGHFLIVEPGWEDLADEVAAWLDAEVDAQLSPSPPITEA
jgi:pimeloyl-ACP methyl ester carboxylesterase